MRELFSASLDDELAELDEARLQAHLAGCGACRAYADTSSAAARLLRTTPLEQPGFPIVVPGRRLAVARRLQAVAAAAAVAVTVGLSVVVGSLGGPGESHDRQATQASNLQFPSQELRLLQRASTPRSHIRLAL